MGIDLTGDDSRSLVPEGDKTPVGFRFRKLGFRFLNNYPQKMLGRNFSRFYFLRETGLDLDVLSMRMCLNCRYIILAFGTEQR